MPIGYITLFLCLILWKLDALANPIWKSLTFINGCTTYDFDGKNLRNFPGQFCIFLDDGTILSASEKSLKRISKDKEVAWEILGHFHHQMNLSHDGKRILALSSEVISDKSGPSRDDVFLVISLEGKIIYKQSGLEVLKFNNQMPLNWPANPPWRDQLKVKFDKGHFNSIHEIPKIENPNTADFMKEGNVIVNSLSLGTFVLSPDLKRVLYAKKNPFSLNHQVHDVQATTDGNFLLFNNLVYGSKFSAKFSAIQKYDPVTGTVNFEFIANPKTLFYSPACGGVQMLDKDHVLFSHMILGAFIYSLKEKVVVASFPGAMGIGQKFIITQEVRARNLSKFFSREK